MNKILKSSSDNKVKLEAVYKPNGELTSNTGETLEVLSLVHFKGHDHDLSAPTTNTSEPPDDLLKTIYNPDRLLEAVYSFEPFKAAEPDTLRSIIIQKTWDHFKASMMHIMVQNHLQTSTINIHQNPAKNHWGYLSLNPEKLTSVAQTPGESAALAHATRPQQRH